MKIKDIIKYAKEDSTKIALEYNTENIKILWFIKTIWFLTFFVIYLLNKRKLK